MTRKAAGATQQLAKRSAPNAFHCQAVASWALDNTVSQHNAGVAYPPAGLELRLQCPPSLSSRTTTSQNFDRHLAMSSVRRQEDPRGRTLTDHAKKPNAFVETQGLAESAVMTGTISQGLAAPNAEDVS